jgi:Uma2 family endonuclease
MDKAQRLTWEEVCADPRLNDLPFKIELNRFNQIVMAPAHARHSRLQTRISRMLDRLMKNGESIVELAVDTADNTKVPDVVWASRAALKRHEKESSWSAAPEICVEVLSPSNTRDEIEFKRGLYFERGAQEVWTCDFKGAMTFHGPEGALARSVLCPKFPVRVKV